MGPNTNDESLMRKLVQNGMDIARFNFSHGDHEEHLGRINMVREAAKKAGKVVSLVLDTKGPEMRLGDFKDGKVMLEKGNKFTLTFSDEPGDETHVSINHKNLYTEVKPGDTLLSGSFLVSGKCRACAEHVGDDNYASTVFSGAKYIKKVNSEIMRTLNKIIKIISIGST